MRRSWVDVQLTELAPEGEMLLRRDRLVANLPEPKRLFWEAFTNCIATNPKSVRYVVLLLAFYMHLGPFSRYVMDRIDQMIAELPADAPAPHVIAHETERRALAN